MKCKNAWGCSNALYHSQQNHSTLTEFAIIQRKYASCTGYESITCFLLDSKFQLHKVHEHEISGTQDANYSFFLLYQFDKLSQGFFVRLFLTLNLLKRKPMNYLIWNFSFIFVI